MSNERIQFLPDTIGKMVLKITLDTAGNENARALLIVLKGGFVSKHSHDKNRNPDSEIYIDLTDYNRNGGNGLETYPEVAGSNSSTGITTHYIEKSKHPQIILAIKKGQQQELWNDFDTNNDLYDYINNLGIKITGSIANEIIITSQPYESLDRIETIRINFLTGKIKYLNSATNEFVTFDFNHVVNKQDDNRIK